ncbi:TPA: hypothetical protein ACH3X1_014408 [Trebouxia sp. C0004]
MEMISVQVEYGKLVDLMFPSHSSTTPNTAGNEIHTSHSVVFHAAEDHAEEQKQVNLISSGRSCVMTVSASNLSLYSVINHMW